MKTIICGAGEVGYSIADKLSKENFEVTVIDESKSRLSKVSEHLDVKTINGVPSLPSVLQKAGANDCEIIIAVTKSDEVNMITCQISYSLFNQILIQFYTILIWLSVYFPSCYLIENIQILKLFT